MAAAAGLEKPVLYVEGEQDKHAIIHLLAAHGVQLDKELGPVDIKAARNDKAVLDQMKTAAKAATGRSVGFILDIDALVTSRWQAVRDRLEPLGVSLPQAPELSGFVTDAPGDRRLGVWLMPDNSLEGGSLEHLLDLLIREGDPLRQHAEDAALQARRIGGRFSESDNLKAIIHTWLAWQKEPGESYGNAIKWKYFDPGHEVAGRFVDWFRKLYALD